MNITTEQTVSNQSHHISTVGDIATKQKSPQSQSNYRGLFDRYAQQIIAGDPRRYDAVEVHGVRDKIGDAGNGGETCVEIENVHPKFFSVYIHLKDDGLECVGDFEAYADARTYADELAKQYSWKVLDAVQAQFADYAARNYAVYNPADLVDCIPLSTGKSIFRRMATNGSKTAFCMDRYTMSDVEYDEFCRLLRRDINELN
ncbi:hypothetical protein LPN04_29825 [Rugamonas sp. A1-17]|nr:hypothetical protein [Rugamonas sp. A1-17]